MTKVFVYGTLKRGQGNHSLLYGSSYLGECHTPPAYSLHDLGYFPGMVRGGHTSIPGEVYEIDDDTLATMDVLEGFPWYYNREQIETPFGTAWVYIYLGSIDNHPMIEQW